MTPMVLEPSKRQFWLSVANR